MALAVLATESSTRFSPSRPLAPVFDGVERGHEGHMLHSNYTKEYIDIRHLGYRSSFHA